MNQSRHFRVQRFEDWVKERIPVLSFNETAKLNVRKNVERNEIRKKFEVKLLTNLQKMKKIKKQISHFDLTYQNLVQRSSYISTSKVSCIHCFADRRDVTEWISTSSVSRDTAGHFCLEFIPFWWTWITIYYLFTKIDDASGIKVKKNIGKHQTFLIFWSLS